MADTTKTYTLPFTAEEIENLLKRISQGGTGSGGGLPAVTEDDNDKIPFVRDGEWTLEYHDVIANSYTPMAITKFQDNIGIMEYGDVVTEVTLSWVLNKPAKNLMLNEEEIDRTLTSKIISGLSITHDNKQLWELTATDARGNSDTASFRTAQFANGIYYGAAEEPTEYDSAFILGLTKVVQNSPVTTFKTTSQKEQYVYYALPVRLKKVRITTDVYVNFELVSTLQFTNAFGYTEQYYLYKSEQDDLGTKTYVVDAYIPPSDPSTGGGGGGGGGGTVVSEYATYYGAVAEPAEFNSAFFNSLTKEKKNGKLTSFTVYADMGEYIYYASPKRFGTCKFTLGTFTGGFERVYIVTADNGNGDMEEYYVYQSDYDGLGATTLTVS